MYNAIPPLAAIVQLKPYQLPRLASDVDVDVSSHSKVKLERQVRLSSTDRRLHLTFYVHLARHQPTISIGTLCKLSFQCRSMTLEVSDISHLSFTFYPQYTTFPNHQETMVHIEEQYQLPRDFEGFGEASHDCKWPNSARIAVSFVLNYEEGGERSILEGDGKCIRQKARC